MRKNKEIRFPLSRSLPCMYKRDDSFAIDPQSFVYKCIEQLGDHKVEIGNLLGKASLQKVANSFYQEDPFQDEECINFNVFPICGGGCPIDRLTKKIGSEKLLFHI